MATKELTPERLVGIQQSAFVMVREQRDRLLKEVEALRAEVEKARIEGVRLGLEAAETIVAEDSHRNLHYGLFADLLDCIRALDPESIAKEADRG